MMNEQGNISTLGLCDLEGCLQLMVLPCASALPLLAKIMDLANIVKANNESAFVL